MTCPIFKKEFEHLYYNSEEFKNDFATPNRKSNKEDRLVHYHAVMEKLNSPELVTFLEQRLAPYLKDPIISQTRIPIPTAAFQMHNVIDFVTPIENIKEHVTNHFPQTLQKIVKWFCGINISNQGEVKSSESELDVVAFTELPDVKNIGTSVAFYHDGYIAGGAIANLINEFFFNTPAVINDVDYFYFDLKSIPTTQVLANEMYEKNSNHYRIKKSYRKDLINFVEFESLSAQVWHNLLNSFDLNCTMFGFHPITKKILINPSAIDYLHTKIIKINKSESFDIDFDESIWNTADQLASFSSVIRAQRKAKELNAIFPVNDYLKQFIWKERDLILAGSPVLISSKRSINHKMTNPEGHPASAPVVFISKKDLVKLQAQPDILMPYFIYNTEKEYLTYQNPEVPAFSFYKNFTCDLTDASAMQEFNRIEALFRTYEYYYPLQDLKNIIYQRFMLLRKYNLLTAQSQRSLKENLLESKLAQLSIFMENHTPYRKIMDELIWNFEWTFNECCNLFLKISKHDHLIGTFEALMSRSFSNVRGVDIKELQDKMAVVLKTGKTEPNFNTILNYVDEVYVKNKEKNTLRKKVSLGCYDKYVTELTLATELEAESRKMNHCVRGYSEKVRSNSSRIFHLKINEKESTLELIPYTVKTKMGKVMYLNYRLQQHTTFNNHKPAEINSKLAQKFIRYLNLYEGFEINKKVSLRKT